MCPAPDGDTSAGTDHLSGLSTVVERFEQAWQAGQRPDIEAHLPAGEGRRAALVELAHVELERRLKAGEAARVEDYLARYPELADDTAVVLDLIAAEYALRRRCEPQLNSAEYAGRFPALSGQLTSRLGADAPGQSEAPSTRVEGPAPPSTRDQRPADPPLPSLGSPGSLRYRPVRFHDRGGLGEVHVAREEELGREVALKRIRREHAGDPESRARFLREAEVTARLEHPGVVPVYGLMRDGDGQPCYAMRFIQGQTLAEAARRFHEADKAQRDPGERALALRQLLARFVAVCDTVAYAHSRGVLHRDIKPANVMLGPYGETLVLDWGLAKPFDCGDEARAGGTESVAPTPGADDEGTRTGQAVGTPAYMSPEQAAGQWGRVGPASDVYGLGATLYCLLTGAAPFRGPALEVLGRVQRGDFPPPRQVKREVPRALEAVCLKAMALRPEERYASALALKEDVESWLAGEPVGAWREPWLVRARRWLGRHRTLVTATAGAVLVAVVALAAATGLLSAANARERQARADAERQRERADANARSAGEQRALALQTLRDVVFDIEMELRDRAQLHRLRGKLLGKAQEGLRRLSRSAETSAQADHSMAWAHFEMGDIFLLLGNTNGAREQYQEGHRIASQLAEAQPDSVEARRDLAVAHGKRGDLLFRVGDARAARDAYQSALDIDRRRADEEPGSVQARRDLSLDYEKLGNTSLHLGDVRAARDAYRSCLDLRRPLADADPSSWPDQHNLSVAYGKVGDASLKLGDARAAHDAYRQALAIDLRRVEGDPENTLARRSLAVSHTNLGDALLLLGQAAAARDAYRNSLDVRRKLSDADPASAQARRDLSVSYDRLGGVSLRLGDVPAAREAYNASLDICRRLAEADRENATAQRDLSVAYEKVGDMSLKLNDPQAARDAYRQALDISRRLAEAGPASDFAQHDLAASYSKVGDASLRLGDARAARDFYRRALDIERKRVDADPANTEARRDLLVAYNKLGGASLGLGDVPGGRDAYRSALDVARQLADTDPTNVQAQADLVLSLFRVGQVHQQEAEYRQAAGCYGRAREVLRRLEEQGKLRGQPRFAQQQKDLEQRIAFCRAAEDLDFALRQPAGMVPALLDLRLRALARRGRHADAVATADKLHDLPPGGPLQLYNAACGYALCVGAVAPGKPTEQLSADEKAARERYAARAVAVLREAVAKGYKDVAHLKKDTDLDPLRGRDDFKKLLAELEAKSKAAPK
jgi:eukaryotic-like serine/threonine-protein kinase